MGEGRCWGGGAIPSGSPGLEDLKDGGKTPNRQDSHSIPALLGRQHCQDTAELGELWRIQGRLSLALKVDSVSRLKLTTGRLMGRRRSTVMVTGISLFSCAHLGCPV